MKIPSHKLQSVKLWLAVGIILVSLPLAFVVEPEMLRAWYVNTILLYTVYVGGNVSTKFITDTKKEIKNVQDS